MSERFDLDPSLAYPTGYMGDTCSVKACDSWGEWDFGPVRLCQDHWEEYSSDAWWNYMVGEGLEFPEWFDLRGYARV